jgi:NAD(P)-dependent dehydrogenase (short-subunit alcohol dehydrogenase family)
MDIRYDDRVVVVTGAAGGIGSQYAREFAARGAKIVANDIGASLDGKSISSDAMTSLAAELERSGAEVALSVDDITDPAGAEALIRTATETFGRVDVLINNAGITRNNLIEQMPVDDYRALLDVHLFGSFYCSKAAWPVMQKQGYGRVLMTTSQSGLYGMETHANYSSAKAGLVGLGLALSLEGREHGINVNVISPMATTRMSEAFLTEEMKIAMHPRSVAAMALWLCSEACSETGQVLEAGMGYFAKVAIVEAEGLIIPPATVTAEVVRDRFGEITDMSNASSFASVADYLQRVGGRVFAPID